MQNRPHLELVLQNKITQKDPLSNTLIDLIRLDKEAKLDSIDTDGKSFLYHALSIGFKEVADNLLSLQMNDDIIFKADNSGKNCLSLAIESNYPDIFKKLLNKAVQANPENPGYKIWLKADKGGNTLLHVAAKHRNIKAAKLILKKISPEKEDERKKIINFKTTIDRNTPLHLSCLNLPTPRNIELIGLLIRHSAELKLLNKDQQTPFNLICTFTLQEQIELIELLLKHEKQEIFLSCYEEHFSDYANNKKEADINDTSMLDNYNILCKERDKIIAYEAATEKDAGGIYVEMAPSPLNFLPRQMQDFSNVKRQKKQILTINNQQLLEENEIRIQEEITRINEFIDNLKTRPAVYISGITLFRLNAFIMIVSYIAIEAWLTAMEQKYYEMYHNHTNPNRDKYASLWTTYIINTILFGTLGGFFLCLLSLTGLAISLGNNFTQRISFMDVHIKISPDEWTQLITNLKTTWLEGMHELERKQALDIEAHKLNENDRLPPQLIHDFENNINVFDNEKKTTKKTIARMTKISENLTSIKNYIASKNTSILPHSMFTHDVKLNMSQPKVEEVNEKLALLSHRVNI